MNLFGRREVRESEKYPRWYGKAYFGYNDKDDKLFKVCYPIPINLIVGLSRRIYQAVRFGLKPSIFDRYIYQKMRDNRDSIWQGGFELGKFDGSLRRPIVEYYLESGRIKIGMDEPINMVHEQWYEVRVSVMWDNQKKVIANKKRTFIEVKPEEVKV